MPPTQFLSLQEPPTTQNHIFLTPSAQLLFHSPIPNIVPLQVSRPLTAGVHSQQCPATLPCRLVHWAGDASAWVLITAKFHIMVPILPLKFTTPHFPGLWFHDPLWNFHYSSLLFSLFFPVSLPPAWLRLALDASRHKIHYEWNQNILSALLMFQIRSNCRSS